MSAPAPSTTAPSSLAPASLAPSSSTPAPSISAPSSTALDTTKVSTDIAVQTQTGTFTDVSMVPPLADGTDFKFEEITIGVSVGLFSVILILPIGCLALKYQKTEPKGSLPVLYSTYTLWLVVMDVEPLVF